MKILKATLMIVAILVGAHFAFADCSSDVEAVMNHVGWKETRRYQNTNMKVKDLLVEVGEARPQVKKYYAQLNEDFSSDKFLNKSAKNQNDDKAMTRIFLNVMINDYLTEQEAKALGHTK